IQRAVPRSSGSPPNTAVHTRRSTISPPTASGLVTLTRSDNIVAAGLSASDISFADWNIILGLRSDLRVRLLTLHEPNILASGIGSPPQRPLRTRPSPCPRSAVHARLRRLRHGQRSSTDAAV